MQEEGIGIRLNGREAGGFAGFLVFATCFHLRDSGAGAAIFGGIGDG